MWQWKWLHICHNDQHNKHFLWLLSGLHCISNHIIKLATTDVSLSNGRGSCTNHPQQQWCVINLVASTYISLLLPTSALSAKNLTGNLIFGPEYGAKHANSHVTDMPCKDSYTEEFANILTGKVIWWHQRCIVCKKLCRKKVH
jgi:hypothetical protein